MKTNIAHNWKLALEIAEKLAECDIDEVYARAVEMCKSSRGKPDPYADLVELLICLKQSKPYAEQYLRSLDQVLDEASYVYSREEK